jgi:hypothetical protein
MEGRKRGCSVRIGMGKGKGGFEGLIGRSLSLSFSRFDVIRTDASQKMKFVLFKFCFQISISISPPILNISVSLDNHLFQSS